MKRNILTVFAAMLLLCLLASCGGTAPAEESGAQTEEATAAPPLSVITGGQTEYVVVRPDAASGEVVQAAIRLRKAIIDLTGAQITLGNDFEKPGTDPASRHPYEILVGQTNREESAQVLSGLRYGDAAVAAAGTRIVLTGGSDEAVIRAVDYFIGHVLSAGDFSLASDFSYVEEGAYTAKDLKIDGVLLRDFTVVYGGGESKNALELCRRIGVMTGDRMTPVGDSSDKKEHEIVIGSRKRRETTADYGSEDFSVIYENGSFYLEGGSISALGCACSRFVGAMKAAGADASSASLCFSYTLPDREVYAADPTQLALRWENEFEPADWMLDFNEKYAAVNNPNGRMMTNLHRGDSVYYPENSLEGYISSVMMGADMLEIDPRLTKDGVFVLMHDATLTRTTDWETKAGKDGLPASANLCDWTFDQLRQLNLKTGHGGASAGLTSFKIPTLEEAVRLCAGRCFIRLDVKGPESGGIYWDFARDIWPLEKKYNAFSTIIFTWHSVFSKNNFALVKDYRARQTALGSLPGISFVGCGAGTPAKNTLQTIKTNGLNPVVRLTDFDTSAVSVKDYIANNAEKLAEFKGKARLYVDAQNSGSNMKETPEYWDQLYEAGISFLLCNESVSFCRYVRDNFTPEPY